MTAHATAADELRLRHYLRRLHARPFGYQEPDIMSDTDRPARPRDWLDDVIDGTATAPATAGADPQPETPKKPARRKPQVSKARDDSDETETAPDDEDQEPGEQPPAWDPTAIADRMVRAYQQRPVTARLQDAARTAVGSRANLGRLAYTVTGVVAAWQVGFTPWLLEFTADAPIGIPIVITVIGWALGRRLDAGPPPVAWCGRALYTATLIALVLHP